MLVDPFFPGAPFRNFPKLDSLILQYYDRVYDTVSEIATVLTPRCNYELGLKIGFRDTFYYIDRLYDTAPVTVIDVGCGECFWKKWFPNIIGFDPIRNEFSQLDFVATFDKEFSMTHTKKYDCGMALNSIHFIDWQDIPSQIESAMNIVNDRFLFTFSFNVMRNKPNLPLADLILLFDNLLKSLDFEIILLDYPLLRGVPEDSIFPHINGHARFILAHKNIKGN